MARYFVECAYQGTAYAGWQRQPNATSVQEVLEDAFSTILNQSLSIVGCGRTDTGVHASQFFFHIDLKGDFPTHFTDRVNKFLPKDIAVYRVFPVDEEAHARFDATRREYTYLLDVRKNPFQTKLASQLWVGPGYDLEKLNRVANLLLDYQEFAPFCKTHSDANTMKCDLMRSEWAFDPAQQRFIYHIAANRFLRGMVRLIVGACLNYSEGRIELSDLQKAMETQSPMPKSRSAPGEGLYLSKIIYPYL
ncbi:MAG: tRNA pseudouridine(38-40) synthase TruA [Bacteroidota bacterium]